jgi:hypothetical protein
MSPEGDRRATGAARVPFDALVEVGGELGPSFEAQAVDISEHGMHLRTAYLPDVGQPLTFRFDAGPGRQFVAAGEVTWREELGKGGEFGVRFTNLDHESAAALARILGPPAAQSPGSRVRLHIDGLASPMRARVKEASQAEITAFSELGFLQVGKQLELEDAQTGAKRPACIDRVDVEIDRESRVPQLVVTLRYEDVSAPEPAPEPQLEAPSAPEPAPAPVEAAAAPVIEEEISVPMEDDAASRMRSAFARGAAKVGPAFANAMKRAKVTVALLAAKRKAGKDEAPLRRTTAPPPGGALHAAGRKVVRSEPEDVAAEVPEVKKLVTKRRAIVAGAVGVAALLAFVAFKKPAPQAPLASAPPPEAAASTAQSPELTTPVAASPLGPLDPSSLSSGAKDDVDHSSHKKNVKVAPFGNGPVAHGNMLHLKMDGTIEKIEGAQQPNGFTVVIPNRRSLEPAGPLAARDARIASIRVSNDPNGAELALAFKDGVPNYQVRAKGDTLEIVLAPVGPVPAHGVQAKHGDADGKPHGKTHKNKPND